MEKNIPPGGELCTLYELQAGICFGAAWSDIGDVLGGQFLSLELGDKSLESVDSSRRKRLAWLFALFGLLPLLVFKYYNFINDSISAGLAAIGLQFSLPGLNWAIPVGISFFTFQAVGYMLDVYHGRVKAEKNLID